MTSLAVVGLVLPQGIVFVVAEGTKFTGVPSDWITVQEYEQLRLERTDSDAGQVECADSEVYDNEEGVHPFR